jgi:hypothetical protein
MPREPALPQYITVGPATIGRFTGESDSGPAPQFNVPVDADMVVVGGGVTANDRPVGKLLTAFISKSRSYVLEGASEGSYRPGPFAHNGICNWSPIDQWDRPLRQQVLLDELYSPYVRHKLGQASPAATTPLWIDNAPSEGREGAVLLGGEPEAVDVHDFEIRDLTRVR